MNFISGSFSDPYNSPNVLPYETTQTDYLAVDPNLQFYDSVPNGFSPNEEPKPTLWSELKSSKRIKPSLVRSPRNSSCENCRRLHKKCSKTNLYDECNRCSELGIKCIFPKRLRKRKSLSDNKNEPPKKKTKTSNTTQKVRKVVDNHIPIPFNSQEIGNIKNEIERLEWKKNELTSLYSYLLAEKHRLDCVANVSNLMNMRTFIDSLDYNSLSKYDFEVLKDFTKLLIDQKLQHR